ncbi:MAG: translation initiation factor IF-1 [Verrucomicrobia bacterium]|nr:translation initiation factor IF-1 [Verrucomicrobiota bacterium]
MPGKDAIELEGTVVEIVSDKLFRVELANGHRLLARLSGALRLNFIRLLPGDKVSVELSAYDLSKGCITRSGQLGDNHESTRVS